MEQPYQVEQIVWRGITIEVRYCADWSPSYREIYGYPLAHLEIESVAPAKAPLPMTETGYRSHFSGAPLIDEEGGPVAFVRSGSIRRRKLRNGKRRKPPRGSSRSSERSLQAALGAGIAAALLEFLCYGLL